MKSYFFVLLLVVILVILIISTFFSKESFVNENEIYVTITTIPERLVSNHFKKCIGSILNQTKSFNKIVLNIPYVYKRTGERYPEIPDWITREKKIIVNRCDDYGPATKLLGGWKVIPEDALILIADDDIIYRENALYLLYREWLQNKNSVVGHSVKERFKGFKEVLGYASNLFPKKLLTGIDTYPMPKSCVCVDDTWISSYLYKKHINVVKIQGSPWENAVDGDETDTHPKWFELTNDKEKKNKIISCIKDTVFV